MAAATQVESDARTPSAAGAPTLSTRQRVLSWRPSAQQVVIAMVVAQGCLLTWMAKDLWFVWGDDYDFILTRGNVPGAGRNWLEPHDDHWMTAVIAIYQMVFHVVGIRWYLPYLLVAIVFHLLLSFVIFRVCRQSGASGWWAATAAMVLLFGGCGGQAVMWSTTMGLIGSLLMGYIAIYVAMEGNLSKGRIAWMWLPLVVGLMFSGTGITATIFATAFVWCMAGWRAGAQVASVPAAVFVTWYSIYGRDGIKPALEDPWIYLQTPSFVWTGMTSTLGKASAVPDAGGALFIALIIGVLAAPRSLPARLRALAYAGVLAAIAQMSLAALSRPMFGQSSFESGRYLYLTLALITPAIVLCLMMVGRLLGQRSGAMVLIVSVCAASYVVNGVWLFHKEAEGYEAISRGWSGIVRGIGAAADDGERVLTTDAEEPVHQRFRADLMADEAMRDKLPTGEATGAERLEAEHRFFTSVGTHSRGVGELTGLSASYGFESQPSRRSECSEIETPQGGALLSAATGADGGEISISGPADVITTWLTRQSDSTTRREWAVEPDTEVYVSTTAKDVGLFFTVSQPGTYRVCRS